MASSSFDIVCEVDFQEVDNAVNQAKREIGTRYDFRGSSADLELSKQNEEVTVTADNELQLNSVIDVLLTKLLKRNVPVKSLVYGKTEPTGKILKKVITVQQGLSKDQCKEITTFIKNSKMKVQAQVMGEQVRVTGKSRDDLQQVIQGLKGEEFGFDMQFVNYR